jgi:colicin import membrane protein
MGVMMEMSSAGAVKPWFKKKRFWVLGVVGISILGAAFSDNSTDDSAGGQQDSSSPASSAPADSSSSSSVAPPPSSASETRSQENARESAESYLDVSAFSRKGLIEQLEFEGFSEADATYGVDSLNVDWNEQAAKSAESYLEFSSFSRKGLIDQLIFEGFTKAQAEYGVAQTGL